MKKAEQYAIWGLALYFVLFAVLHLLNLDRIPLVWFDEVMGLDPAVNKVFKDGFVSRIWPQDGTEQRFMAYLPIRFLFHMFHLTVLPFEVFWQRLPWAIYFLTAALLLYRSAKTAGLKVLWALIVVFLFINDKAVFEVARSMRVDPLSMMFLAALGLAYYKKAKWLQALLAAFLIFIHPNLWVISLLLFLNACSTNRIVSVKPHVFWIIPIVAILAYSLSIDFDFSGFQSQLLEHESYHDAEGGLLNRLKDHFVRRFWPYYSSQVWMPLIIYGALGWSLLQVWKGCGSIWHWSLIATHLYWLLALAPFYRYNAVLLLLSLMTILPVLKGIELNKWQSAIAVLFLLASPLNVLARHTLAIAERSERNPREAIEWIQAQIGSENALILGHDIAYYAVALDENKDYMMFNLPSDKFNYDGYDQHYALLSEFPDSSFVFYDSLPKIYFSESEGKKANWKLRVSSLANRPNYDGLMLFKIRDEKAFNALHTFMDSHN